MAEKVLEMSGISKSFFGVNVLKNVQLTVEKKQVHVLMGENGAGKSTLIKILSGAYSRESGKIVVDGEELLALSPGEMISKGVSVIYQEFNLVDDMPIYENIFLGKEIMKGRLVDHEQEISKAKEFMGKVGLTDDPKTLIRDLSVAKKQLVEISKAISNNVKILVLDEPTAAITDKETDMLFSIVEELKAQGIGIIYISHRMSELFRIGDVCTVLRDGEYVATMGINEITEDILTEMMVGRKVSFDKITNECYKPDEVVLSVRGLNYKDKVIDVSFDLHKGEILGFSGLVGAGRTETAKAVIGCYKKDSGEIIYKGEELGSNLAKNIKKGIVYLSEDRKDEGLVLPHSLQSNISLPNLDKVCRPFRSIPLEHKISREYIDSLKIKAFDENVSVESLSGGNMQKVVIAKWLYSDADIYIFDEPTRGIDVGARDEIYNIMQDLLKKGASIIMISSDLVEVLKMSDNIAVMSEGRLKEVLFNNGTVTQQDILKIEMSENTAV